MKRIFAAVLLMQAWAQCLAQVEVDRALVFSATDSAQRSVEGLARAVNGTALVTLDDVRDGTYHTATTSGTAMSIALSMHPPCSAYRPGLSIRFVALKDASGAVKVNVDGLGAKYVTRSDGLPVAFNQIAAGRMVQLVYGDTAFVIHDRDHEGCPSGFIQANDRLCLQINDTLNISVYNASRWCMDRGAKLCTWDEYIFACTSNQPQLLGLFDDWEWVDDTSDHTHSAVQVGRYQCRSERSTSAVETTGNYGGVRCCYHLR